MNNDPAATGGADDTKEYGAFERLAETMQARRAASRTRRYISFDVALKTLSVCVARVAPDDRLRNCPICRGYAVAVEHWAMFDIPSVLGRSLNLKDCKLFTGMCLMEDFLRYIATDAADTYPWWNAVLGDARTTILIETQQKRFGERQRCLSVILGGELYRRYERTENSIQYVSALLKNTDQENPFLQRVEIPRRPGRSKTPAVLPPLPVADTDTADADKHTHADMMAAESATVQSLQHDNVTTRNQLYGARKNASVRAALILLRQSGQEDWLHYFLNDTQGKRDDYADALTQLFYYHLKKQDALKGAVPRARAAARAKARSAKRVAAAATTATNQRDAAPARKKRGRTVSSSSAAAAAHPTT